MSAVLSDPLRYQDNINQFKLIIKAVGNSARLSHDYIFVYFHLFLFGLLEKVLENTKPPPTGVYGKVELKGGVVGSPYELS